MNWYKIKYEFVYEKKPRDVYVEIFKATDPDDLMDKWDKFKKVTWQIADVELLERGEASQPTVDETLAVEEKGKSADWLNNPRVSYYETKVD